MMTSFPYFIGRLGTILPGLLIKYLCNIMVTSYQTDVLGSFQCKCRFDLRISLFVACHMSFLRTSSDLALASLNVLNVSPRVFPSSSPVSFPVNSARVRIRAHAASLWTSIMAWFIWMSGANCNRQTCSNESAAVDGSALVAPWALLISEMSITARSCPPSRWSRCGCLPDLKMTTQFPNPGSRTALDELELPCYINHDGHLEFLWSHRSFIPASW